jgi:hypothetical protein
MSEQTITLEFTFKEWETIREALINLAAQRMHIAPARVAKTIDKGILAQEYRNSFRESIPKVLAEIITDEMLDRREEEL